MRRFSGKCLWWLIRRENAAARRLPDARNESSSGSKFFEWNSEVSPSGQQRRPCRIGCIARSRYALLVAARDIDRVERRSGIAAGIAEEHDHAAVRREGRPLVVEAFRQDALARSVRLDDSDRKFALRLLG